MILTRRAVLFFLALPSLARAEDDSSRAGPSAGDPLAAIAKARAQMKSLAGPFTQVRTIGLLKSTVTSRGTMTLVRPDRLRWELAPPDDVTYWVGPEGLAYRGRGGTARVSAAQSPRLAAALADLHALLGDPTPLRARYELAAKGTSLDAVPRDLARAPYKKIALELAPDLVRPTRVTLIEGPRDRTEITFGDLIVNGPVDPKLVAPPQ
jgi:outer membrane lipoprotein-sorting protein